MALICAPLPIGTWLVCGHGIYKHGRVRRQDTEGKGGEQMLSQLARSPAVSDSLCCEGWEEAEEPVGRE